MKAIFDGQLAGSKANSKYKYDEESMRGILDNVFMSRFRLKLASELGVSDTDFAAGYDGLMQMIHLLHSSTQNKEDVVETSRRTLCGLFPNWPPFAPKGKTGLLWWFGVLFATPFPAFSARLNALVTWWAAQWLMGPCTLEDLLPEDVSVTTADTTARGSPSDSEGLANVVRPGQRLVVHRCRFLEEANCASVCLHTCKLPTQRFFNADMSVPMRMIPDYETFECVFEFGNSPTPEDEADARSVSCFSNCPSRRAPSESQLVGACMPLSTASGP